MTKNLTLTKAQNAATAHDWTTAARIYKELLREDGDNEEYLNAIGNIYSRAGEDAKAIPYYERIISSNPKNFDAMISLGGIYRRLKRYNEAVNILLKALNEGGKITDIEYNLGFTYKEMGDYQDAIESFESVIEKDPDDVLTYNHLGSIYFAKKDYEKSVAEYKRGLQVDQNHPVLNYNLARSYVESKNYPEAVKCFEAALKTRPGWIDAIRDFSRLLIKCQHSRHAQELVEQSIKLHPNDDGLLCMLGKIYLNQFDYDNATKTYRRANLLRENDIKILISLAESLEKNKKIDDAVVTINDALELDASNIEARKSCAHMLLSLQHYEKAIEMIQKIDEETGSKDPEVFDLYGQYFICRGDDEAANTYYQKIQKSNKSYSDYLLNAAERYVQTGNFTKAIDCAKEYIERNPRVPDGYNTLAKVHFENGDLIEAKKIYEKSLDFHNPNIFARNELKKINEQLFKDKQNINDEGESVCSDTADYSDRNAAGSLESASESDLAFEEQNPDDFDYEQMGDDSPIEEVLQSDYDFWEDFDDSEEEQGLKPREIEEENLNENAEETESRVAEKNHESGDSDISDVFDENNFDDTLKDDEEFDFSKLADDNKAIERAPFVDAETETEINSEHEPAEFSDVFEKPEETLAQAGSQNEASFEDLLETSPAFCQAQETAKNARDIANDAMNLASDVARQLERNLSEKKLNRQESSEELNVPKNIISGSTDETENTEPESEKSQNLQESIDVDPEPIKWQESKTFESVTPDYTFLTVDDVISGKNEQVEQQTGDSKSKTDAGITPAGMIDKIELILNDNEIASENAEKIELFKALKELSRFLPEEELNSFSSCKMRLKIEYLIEKLSGKPGLLMTAESLLKSGVLGKEFSSRLDVEYDEKISNHLIKKVFKLMQKLSENLEDREIANALCISADGMLEQIELENEKSRIF